jgi:exonuclease SbcD
MSIRAILTSDNHLDPAAMQYGPRRYERKEDFLRSFDAVIDYALKNKPDLFLVSGDLFDNIQPRNPTRARTMDQFRMLHEKGVRVFLVSGHHDTPKSVEQGSSPISVYANSRYVTFFQDFNKPTSLTFTVNGKEVQVAGISFNPVLPWGSDPLQDTKLTPHCDVNIFMLHYSIEGFSGYGKFEPLVRANSLPKDFQLVAAGHLHRHQRSKVGVTQVIYPGSTERVNFSEETEDKGFLWLELDKNGINDEEFIKTPARTLKTVELKLPKEGSIDRFVKEALSQLEDPKIVLRYKLMGAVSTKQLSTYRRSDILSSTQGKFFTVIPDEDGLEIVASKMITALPRTTPLEELRRYFKEQMEKVTGDEDKKILVEALRLCEKRLQEAGAW